LTYVVAPNETNALAALNQNYGIQVRSVQRSARRNTVTRAWHKLFYYYGSYLFTSLPGPVRFNSQPVMRSSPGLRLFSDVICGSWFMTGFADRFQAIHSKFGSRRH
jgi:hypothetical protein